ncbi:MAG: cytochrome c-type biogenesis protein [Pseudomonadota bacterium]|nr:cytochrome c-type biogenesis protein [Pseudomonadota bacterium]
MLISSERWGLAMLATIFCAGVVGPMVGFTATPVDVYEFKTEEQETRYRTLIAQIRCPKCLNTNIAGSDATSAQTLRAAVHRLVVTEGKSNEEVLAFMRDRYGDFVLYDPPLNASTWIVWWLPVVIGLIGLLVVIRILKRANASPSIEVDVSHLDPATQEQFRKLTSGEKT